MPASSIVAWLTGLAWDSTQETGTPIVAGPYVPDMPDRICVITATPGPGYLLEGAADAGAFQARVRGPQDDPAAAEAAAFLLDRLIKNARFPVTVNGQVLVHVHRLAGQPAFLTGPSDDGNRFELTCQYIAIAGDP